MLSITLVHIIPRKPGCTYCSSIDLTLREWRSHFLGCTTAVIQDCREGRSKMTGDDPLAIDMGDNLLDKTRIKSQLMEAEPEREVERDADPGKRGGQRCRKSIFMLLSVLHFGLCVVVALLPRNWYLAVPLHRSFLTSRVFDPHSEFSSIFFQS
jgi:hypothetical protein